MLAGNGVTVSRHAVWLFLKREDLCFKRTLFAFEQSRTEVARRRERWKRWQPYLDPNRLVFWNLKKRKIQSSRYRWIFHRALHGIKDGYLCRPHFEEAIKQAAMLLCPNCLVWGQGAREFVLIGCDKPDCEILYEGILRRVSALAALYDFSVSAHTPSSQTVRVPA